MTKLFNFKGERKMKNLFTITIYIEEVAVLESTLNYLKIGLNNWNRSQVVEIQGRQLVNYAIVCSESEFTTINNVINKIRVY